MESRGYQPTETKLDRSNPPKQGSGVPNLNHKSMESNEHFTGELPETPRRPPNHTEVRICNEITEFMEQRPNIVNMYQTDPHMHNLLTQAIINKTTVADLLEGMLIVSCRIGAQFNELLKKHNEKGDDD